ncbi:unnamed protein product [Parnassius mnemosyne]|uniref:Uncharacterized protein n=1 Tax=Parnassius mnemosyne TaxID=213953 RepID=A0AAV1L111_9NEOP
MYVVYGAKALSETGLFGRLEVVKSARETIRNDSRKQHVDAAQKGNRSVVLQESVVTFLENKTTALLLHACGVMPPWRTELKSFCRTSSTGLPPAFRSSAVIPSSPGALPFLRCWRAILISLRLTSGISSE